MALKLASLGVGERVARPLAWALLVALALVAATVAWRVWLGGHDAAVVGRADNDRQLTVERGARAADQRAEAAREARSGERIEREKEWTDATAHLAPAGLTDRQRLRVCRELRRAGRDITQLAKCRDLPPGA